MPFNSQFQRGFRTGITGGSYGEESSLSGYNYSGGWGDQPVGGLPSTPCQMSRECAPLPMQPMSMSYMPPPTYGREAFKPWVGGGGYPAPDQWNPQGVPRRGSHSYDGRRNYNGRRINNHSAVCC
mmetsp:Transcript_36088/g.95853  ORF Transcript_36088/g.95853 Transcript_36088/m.95853 type:complete len:125 (-) Transcript_36088:479-853(-)